MPAASLVGIGSETAIKSSIDAQLTGLGEPLELHGLDVSPNFFATLGVNPVRGRAFLTGAGAVLNTFRAGPGDAIAVLGAGAVGLAAIMAAAAAGSVIVAVDQHPGRLAMAERFGAIAIYPAPDLPDRIKQLTDGGAQYALDTTGSTELINAALTALRPTGHLGLVARLHATLPLEPGTLDRGRRLSHICEGDAVPGLLIPRLTELWQAGRFPFDQLIRTYPLEEINEAEHDCEAGRVVKPVLIPHT